MLSLLPWTSGLTGTVCLEGTFHSVFYPGDTPAMTRSSGPHPSRPWKLCSYMVTLQILGQEFSISTSAPQSSCMSLYLPSEVWSHSSPCQALSFLMSQQPSFPRVLRALPAASPLPPPLQQLIQRPLTPMGRPPWQVPALLTTGNIFLKPNFPSFSHLS